MLNKFFKRGAQGENEAGKDAPASDTPAGEPAAEAPATSAAPASASPQPPSEPQGPRLVYCVKLKRELPGLDRPPFSGELGQRIYDNVSAAAWDLWKQQAVMLVNHYGLVGVDPDARRFLNEQMEVFLFEDEEQMPEGWVPEGQGGGAKGAPSAKGAPAAKGAAPRK